MHCISLLQNNICQQSKNHRTHNNILDIDISIKTITNLLTSLQWPLICDFEKRTTSHINRIYKSTRQQFALAAGTQRHTLIVNN